MESFVFKFFFDFFEIHMHCFAGKPNVTTNLGILNAGNAHIARLFFIWNLNFKFGDGDSKEKRTIIM